MFSANAQDKEWHSSKLIKTIVNAKDSIIIDSLSIIPGSLYVENIDTSFYQVDYFRSILYWKKVASVDSIVISYRTFPLFFYKKFFHKDAQKIEQNFTMTPYYYNAEDAGNTAPFVDFGNVNYLGSFGRALSFGNSQDVILNSQFNLQFDGELGDSIHILGAITDNNIPFQPQGNTQQIQEFDKVFIQLKRKKTTLTVGDYEMKSANTYFMNYYKRVQGAMISNSVDFNKNLSNKMTLGASLAKGKFSRNTIVALEGNQGPYKLTGPNGEQFFIVLAGTEKVYLDGMLLQRGEDLDYIIDYNTAEVTFMPKRLITKDLRIVIEFELADRNYLNSLVYFNDEISLNNKLYLKLNVYSNQDAKNQGIQQTLDSTQKRFLSTIGDSIHQAYYPSVVIQDTFSTNQILYKKIDTQYNGILYRDVYIHSSNPDSAKYSLSFSSVGTNNGNYVQSINISNGRVYAWVPPINGVKQGDYEPIVMLVTPKKQQLVSLGMDYKIDANKNLIFESALSNQDPNLFSPIDNNHHTGIATKLTYDEKRILNAKKDILLKSKLNYEYTNYRFKPLEPYRSVEFNRDWNLDASEALGDEHVINFSTKLQKTESKSLEYLFGSFIRTAIFTGSQHSLVFKFQEKNITSLVKGIVMQQTSSKQNSTFYRPSVELEKLFNILHETRIGSKLYVEHNEIKDKFLDTLLKSSFSYDALTFYIKNNQQNANSFMADYTIRHDRIPINNELKQNNVSNTFSLNTQIVSIKNQEIRLNGSYRKLTVNDTTLTNIQPEESLLGRVDYHFSFLKGLITGNLFYEMGAGQEPKREYTYVKVVAGQGQYVWRDYNKDSIEQLNEFELAIFPDEKLYIRIFTPTNQYVKAKYSNYNHSIIVNPKAAIHSNKKSFYYKLITALYFQSNMQINNRFVGKQGLGQYNPFNVSQNDSLLLSATNTITNSLFFNRFNSLWGMDYTNTINSNNTLMTYGIDTRKSTEHLLRSRVNVNKKTTLGLNLKSGIHSYNSFFLEDRNYEINQKSVEPTISWITWKTQLRIQTSYRYDDKRNNIQFGNEVAKMHNINFELRYNIVTTGSVNLKTSFAKIRYNGADNTSISYAMLEALQVGQNYIWQLSFDKRISKNIEMSLQYDGRKSLSTPAVHTGRATVRAVF